MFMEPTILDKSFPEEHKHCVTCILLNCKEDSLCSLVHCTFCGVRLHKCKLEDHIEYICGKAPCPCPNTIYGCNVRLRRQLIAQHITFCSASLVFCPFVRNRQFYSAKAKKLLKRIARTGEKLFPESEKTEEELNELAVPDVAISLIDQKILTKFFKIPRKRRSTLCPAAIAMDFIRQNSLVINKIKNYHKDFINESNEREKKFFKRQIDLTEPDSDYFDSSDEERQEIVTPNIPFLGIVLGEEYLSINYPIFGCSSCFIPRSQFNSHYASHNILDESAPYNFFARCPNWQRGCSFKMFTLTPLNGNGVFR
uniref:TRAF-type domain-containing protein n=1 Tax=Meloidogyne hapla TaxID=6305 RepID=A0A1I8C0F7_MELHA